MTKPNIVMIYVDDLGYGDLSCYGAEDIHTPNIDKLAENGIRFDDAYASSAVCTPARYSLLTGDYPFRNPYTEILAGDAQCIISKEQMTLPKMLKCADYTTAVIGKWHLGLGDGNVDWNKTIEHTPNDVGFDYSYIFPGTNDRVPCVYVKNRDVVNLDSNDPIEVYYGKECPFDDIDTYEKNPEKLRLLSSHGHNHSIINGVGRIGYMKGGSAAIWKDEDLTDAFLTEAKNFMTDNAEQPFFLYYAAHQPHVPRLPSKQFEGLSGLGARGDVILELDWCVGEIMQHLQKLEILDNTIVIFSSDNGPVLNDGYLDQAVEKNGKHRPAGPLRGGKYSKFDGGARIPMLISWNNHIVPRISNGLISQMDLLASFASMLGVTLSSQHDSQNVLDVLLGNSDNGRSEVMYESVQKIRVLREGKWVYLPPSKGVAVSPFTGIELGNGEFDQLYNLQYDISQHDNVAEEYPAIVEKMKARLAEILNN